MTEDGLRLAPSIHKDARPQERYFVGLLLVITAMTYLDTLKYDFVYDDIGQILLNPFIKSWSYLPRYFLSPLWQHASPQALGNYYRPLFLLWSRVNYSMFKTQPFGWHATTVLLHLLVTGLVYLVVREMTVRAGVAWLTALIFGVHPIHHEVVAWVSGSTESLFATFFLAAFLAYLYSRKQRQLFLMICSCGFFGLALLSKETAIILPILVFIHGWIADSAEAKYKVDGHTTRFRRGLTSIAGYVPVALIYLGLRFRALSSLGHAQTHVSFFIWLLTLPSILFFYVKHWLLPIHLSEFYDVFYQLAPNLVYVVLPALLSTAIVSSIWIFRERLGRPETGYAAAWIIVPLLPALDVVVFRPDELVHDRYFYLPSIGAALLVALLINPAGRQGALVFGQSLRLVVTALVLAALLGIGTIRATWYWSDDLTFYKHGHEIAPRNSVALNNLSLEWIIRGKFDEAQALLEENLREQPDDWQSHYSLGRVHYSKGRFAKAEEYLRQSIALNPTFPDPYVILGQIELKAGRRGDALNSTRRATELNPFNAQYHEIYGIMLASNGNCPDAMTQFKSAEVLEPGDFIVQREMFRCGSTANPGATSITPSAQR